jgi:hypothetical protein
MKRMKALPVGQSNTANAYSIHIQAKCYFWRGKLINNSNGVDWPGLVHICHGTHCHLNTVHWFRAVTAALETKGPLIDSRWLWIDSWHLSSFYGFRATTAALETKGPPIDNRWLWIDSCHLNSFHGFRATTAALETKRPPIDNRWLWIDSCHLNSFHGFRATTAALETKGPPIDNRWLWIDYSFLHQWIWTWSLSGLSYALLFSPHINKEQYFVIVLISDLSPVIVAAASYMCSCIYRRKKPTQAKWFYAILGCLLVESVVFFCCLCICQSATTA